MSADDRSLLRQPATAADGRTAPHDDHAKVGILAASLLAAILASAVLSTRNRHYRAVEAEESADTDQAGIPDVYERDNVK